MAIIAFLLLPHSAFALTSNDPDQEFLWHLDQINAPDAWEISTGSSDVIVAVIDAGIDHNHEDLEDNYWENEDEIAGNGIDDDGNGFIDDTYGWDFMHDDNSPIPVTGVGSDFPSITHGTIIAGLIGAVGNNNRGIVGVNWDVDIMVLRALNRAGFGDSVDVADAVYYAIDNGADIINLSLAGDSDDPILQEALQEAYDSGVTIIVAAGNEDRDTDSFPSYPSCYEGDDGEDIVIGVASSDPRDDKSDFSNYGENCVDISAPGESIYSTQYDNPSKGYDDAYGGFWGGTSFAAPVVAGAAALLLSVYPDLSPDDVRIVLQLSADPLDASPAYSGKLGTGRLNLAAALELGASFSDASMDEPEEEPEDEPEEDIDSPESNIPGIFVGQFIKAPSFSTVYLVDSETTRRPFMNDTAYFTHADSFDEIVMVADDELRLLDLRGLVVTKEDVVLVKIQSDPRTYKVEENEDSQYEPILREIETEEIAIDMYGSRWADYIVDVEPTFFTKYETGAPIDEAIDVDVSKLKTREEIAASS